MPLQTNSNVCSVARPCATLFVAAKILAPFAASRIRWAIVRTWRKIEVAACHK